MNPSERERLRAEYRRRDDDPRVRGRYAPGDPGVRLAQQDLGARLRRLLRDAGPGAVSGRVLEVGCGSGGLLPRLADLAAPGTELFGLDLSAERLAAAAAGPVRLRLVQGDASELPFPDGGFDLVAQSTLVSSVLDPTARRAIAREMVRVLRPGGCLLWYDFIWNPVNRATRGVGRAELADLFPGLTGRLERATLAPPIARPIARRSLRLAALLGRVPFLRSHYLALLRSPSLTEN